ncbi:MAG: TrkH family potassium uptake protein [Rhodobacteraceae bacterium]|nr:TrkH family potassium uptake protein [Paracoccaceae bacterium]
MYARLVSLPLFVLLMAIGSAAMIVPSIHALAIGNHAVSRVFFYWMVLFLILTTLIAIAASGSKPKSQTRSHLSTLVAAYLVLPAMLAVPFFELTRGYGFLSAWFEMVSSFTTTGATLFDRPYVLPHSLHLWRGLVGWLGGLFIWVVAVALLAPLNLGGFEVRAQARSLARIQGAGQSGAIVDPSERLIHYAARLAPLYAAATGLMWLGLILAGETPFVAVVHAMSVMSTSGISPIGGLYPADSGILGELIMFPFFFFALSRLTFSRGLLGEERTAFWKDPEFRLGVALVLLVPSLLFLRHFFVGFDLASLEGLRAALRSFWGATFTVMSFLTTTGFEAHDWTLAARWAGLPTPGLALVGLALVGGGIATTAGGVKLLRVYALIRHSERELERLVHPHSLGGAGQEARRVRRQGAFVAWAFFMIFAISICGVIVLLSLTGVQFETATVLAVAAISTTGPLAEVAAEDPIAISGIPDAAKFILMLTMVLGRLEAMAIIALLNPDIWRK